MDQSGEESSFAFLCGAVAALPAPQSGIEQVSHGIAEHVEAVHHDGQEDPRPHRQPRRHLHVPAPLSAQQAAPAGNVQGQPKAQEAQRGLGDDDGANGDAEDDDDGREHIRQHVVQHSAPTRIADGLRGLEVDVLLDADHGAPDHARVADPIDEAQHDDDLQHSSPHDRHDRHEQQQSRKSQPGIDESLRHHVEPAPDEPRETADGGGHQHCHGGCRKAHKQRLASAEDVATQEVASDMIGSQRMLNRRPL